MKNIIKQICLNIGYYDVFVTCDTSYRTIMQSLLHVKFKLETLASNFITRNKLNYMNFGNLREKIQRD